MTITIYTPNKYARLQGTTLAKEATSVLNAYDNLGNIEELMLEVTETKTDHRETNTGDRKIDLRITTETTVNVTITLSSLFKENWAKFLRGSLSAQSGATITGEAITAPAVGKYFELANKNITSITSLTPDPVATAYVASTDYIAYPPNNLIFVPPGSAMAGDAILANYVCGAVDVIGGLNTVQKEYRLIFAGINTVDSKKPVTVELFKVSFDPPSTINLISDELTTFQVKGTVLYDPTFDAASGALDLGGYFRVTQTV